MSKVGVIEAGYFPHEIRNYAFDVSTKEWSEQHRTPTPLCDWGEYIVSLINDYEGERSPGKVAERVIKIHEAMEKTKCPKRLSMGPLKDKEQRKELTKPKFYETAREDGLRLVRIKPDPKAIGLIKEIMNIAGGPVFSGIKIALLAMQAIEPNRVGKIGGKNSRHQEENY